MAVSLASDGSWQSNWIRGWIHGMAVEWETELGYIGTCRTSCMEVMDDDGTRKYQWTRWGAYESPRNWEELGYACKEGEEPALCHDQDIHKHSELTSSPNNHPPSSDSSKSAESSSSTTDLPLVTSPLSPRSSTTTEWVKYHCWWWVDCLDGNDISLDIFIFIRLIYQSWETIILIAYGSLCGS